MKYSPLRHAGSIIFKRRPLQFTVFLTRRCNARCAFCFYLSREGNGHSTDELSVAEIDRVSGSLGSLLWLAFSGGEIFLRDDLGEIVDVFYRNTRPAFILLPTNGLMPERILQQVEAIAASCPKSTVVVKLSLDGPPLIHDSLRGVKGAFDRAERTYRGLWGLLDRYPNLEIGINTVFCTANQDAMEETFRIVRTMDRITTHTVSLIRGGVSDPELKMVDMDKYRKAARTMESDLLQGRAARYRFGGARLKAAQDILQRKLIYESAVRNQRMVPCFAGKLNLVMTESGAVYPCESFMGEMGNVREAGYDIKDILGSGRAREIIRAIEKDGCHCTHECYMMTNILFNPALYPVLLTQYLRI